MGFSHPASISQIYDPTVLQDNLLRLRTRISHLHFQLFLFITRFGAQETYYKYITIILPFKMYLFYLIILNSYIKYYLIVGLYLSPVALSYHIKSYRTS